jgi:glucokinase
MCQNSQNMGEIGLAVDLGGTKISGALFNTEGMVSPKKVLYREKREGRQVGELLVELIGSLLEWSAANSLPASAVGVAVPGIYHAETGRVWAPNIPGWDDYPLLEELTGQFGSMGIGIDSDRACYILGETWKGASVDCQHAIFLAVGTGIGAGILIDGKVLRGSGDIAGAVGWMALTDPFLEVYKTFGCFEYHASGPGISRMARKAREHHTFQGEYPDIQDNNKLTARAVFEAYQRGNPLAGQVMAEAIRYWGKASANLVSLFNPEKIIFGGGVFGPATQFLEDIYKEAKKWAQPISIERVAFVPSKLGGDAGLYGAGFLSLQATE